MSLNIGSSLTGGVRRVANRNGLKLGLSYAVFAFVWQLLYYSAVADWAGTSVEGVPTIDAAPVLVMIGAVVSLLALQYVAIVAVRTFVGGRTKTIPREYYTRNIVYVVINSLLGGLVFVLLVAAGTVLLIVPGVIAYTALVFTFIYIADKDESFISALRDSWTLTRGHWLDVFGLLFALSVASVICSIILSFGVLLMGFVVSPLVLYLSFGLNVALFSLLAIGVVAEAYTQLRGT
ncbi:hypothetical protein [Halobacterium salinarum]|uniref:hypothetical protein n=1 Tax=Halobacterium salinarum TaxID=2242 RepID=UPI001F2E39F6|nr:hypothetical protein [Halobacterium salinarum]MCF2237637.1 hypothetical protein [Halobacterium salinarum]